MVQNCLFYTFPNIQNNCQNSRNFIKNNNYLSLILCFNLFSYPFLISAFFKQLNTDSISVVNVKNSVNKSFCPIVYIQSEIKLGRSLTYILRV